MITLQQIIEVLEAVAPLSYQESYDNSGLQIGRPDQSIRGALLCLDVTEAVVAEAIAADCNLIIAHHPLLFTGLKKITGQTFVERIVQEAVRNDIAIYAAHTNLDNVDKGVNHKIATRLGLLDLKILAPLSGKLLKLYTYVPVESFEAVQQSLFEAGAGAVGNYAECSYSAQGTGTFRPLPDSDPAIGQAGGKRESVKELKLEVLLPAHLQHRVLSRLRAAHPYEEVAYELIALTNEDQSVGAGMIGRLSEPLAPTDFLTLLQEKMACRCIRYTTPPNDSISTVAVCGGSGSFLLPQALRQHADVFVTADFKYHQFFDADHRIMIADIGHYESEQFTMEIFSEILKKKFPNFATLFTKYNTNPVNYFI